MSMMALGYVNKKGKPDASRFSLDHRYLVTSVHKWLTDTTPELENIERLAKDLKVSRGWLLFGEGSPRPKLPRGPKGSKGTT